MAYTTIDDPSDYFEAKLYVGNESTNAITGLDFQPDWVWLKNRDTGYYHGLYDSVRGTGNTKSLYSNAAETEGQNSGNMNLASFNSNGFTLGATSSTNIINKSSQNHVSWNWKAGTSFSNSSGSNGANLDSAGSVSTDAGFSIVSFTGNRSTTRNIYHGLGAVPKMIIFKNRDTTNGWTIYNEAIGNANKLTLNATNASGGCSACFASTNPTSTLFSVGDDSDTNGTSNNMIAYCFAEKQGYSKFGSYTGNGNADGTFVYTGFKPAFVIIKKTNSTGDWTMYDNKRIGYNGGVYRLKPNTSESENTSNVMDLLSNGFKLKVSDGDKNGSGDTFIFMCFAENPFTTSTGVPATAR